MGIIDWLFGSKNKAPEDMIKEFAESKEFKNRREKYRALQGNVIEMECPACHSGRVRGHVGSLGIVNLNCDACGWSGSTYIT